MSTSAVSAIVLIDPCLSGVFAAELPTWNLARMQGLASAGWSKPDKDGVRAFRSARGGRGR